MAIFRALLSVFFSFMLASTSMAEAVLKTPLTFASLRAFIELNGIRSVDELIPRLPPDLLSNYTYVFSSRAPEAASTSMQLPRVILFGRDARFVLAWSGDTRIPKDFNSVQILEFDDSKKRFFPRQIIFQPQLNFVEKPTSCARCHGLDAKPLWEGDPYWPGVYGQTADMLELDSNEANAFKDFLENEKKNGRYAALRTPTPLFPYRLVEQIETADRNDQDLSAQPNRRLTRAFQALNAERVFRIWRESPAFEKHKYRAAWYLLGCDDSEAMAAAIQKGVQDFNAFIYFAMHLQTTDISVRGQDLSTLPRRIGPNRVLLERAAGEFGIPLRDISLSAFHLRANDQDMEGLQGAVSIHSDLGTIAQPLLIALLTECLKGNASLRKIFEVADPRATTIDDTHKSQICEVLEAASAPRTIN